MYVWANSPKYICNACRNKIPIGDLEAIYREQLAGFLLSPQEIAAHREAELEAQREKERLLAGAETDLAELDAEEKRILQLYYADRISMDDFGRMHRPLSERRKQLIEELPRLQAELDVLRIGLVSSEEALQEARDLSARWADLEREEKRQIVEAITDRTVVGKEDVEIVLLQLPSGNDVAKAMRSHREPLEGRAGRGQYEHPRQSLGVDHRPCRAQSGRRVAERPPSVLSVCGRIPDVHDRGFREHDG
jgi:site-specific DNA recombinase